MKNERFKRFVFDDKDPGFVDEMKKKEDIKEWMRNRTGFAQTFIDEIPAQNVDWDSIKDNYDKLHQPVYNWKQK